MKSAFQQYVDSIFKKSRHVTAMGGEIPRQNRSDNIIEDLRGTNNNFCFARDEVILGIPAQHSSEKEKFIDTDRQRLDFYVSCTSDNFEPFRQWAYEKLTASDKYQTTDRRILQIEQSTCCQFSIDDHVDNASILHCLNSPPTLMYRGELHRKITIHAQDAETIVEILGLLEDSVPDLMRQMKMIQTVDWFGTRRWPRKGEMAICRRPSGSKAVHIPATALQGHYEYLPWKMQECVESRRLPKKSVKGDAIVETLIEMFADKLEQREKVQRITDEAAEKELHFQMEEGRTHGDGIKASEAIDQQSSKRKALPELNALDQHPGEPTLTSVREQLHVSPSPKEELSTSQTLSGLESEIGNSAVEEAAHNIGEECIDNAIEKFGEILLSDRPSTASAPNIIGKSVENVLPVAEGISELDSKEASLETKLGLPLDLDSSQEKDQCNGSMATEPASYYNENTQDGRVSVEKAMLNAKIAVCKAEEEAEKEKATQSVHAQEQKYIIGDAVKEAQKAIEIAEKCVKRAQEGVGRIDVSANTNRPKNCSVVAEDIANGVISVESFSPNELRETKETRSTLKRCKMRKLLRKMKATAYSFHRPSLQSTTKKEKDISDRLHDISSSSIEDFNVESAMFEMCDSTMLKTLSETSSMWALTGSLRSNETVGGSVSNMDSISLNDHASLWPILRNSDPCESPARRCRLVFRLDN